MNKPALVRLLSSAYGIEPTRIETLSATDTALYRIHAGADRYALRIHGQHTEAEIASNMQWLYALRETDVRAPVPLRTRTGAWVTRHATLVRWVEGRRRRAKPRPVHYERLGRLMAELHEHVGAWPPPCGFTRPPWRAAEVFCERGVGAPADGNAWRLVPQRFVPVLQEACAEARPALDEDDLVLIHADLHLANVVFAGDRACPIDFDDAGFGSVGYDVASALAPARFEPTWPGACGAFMEGYEQVRSLPDLSRLDAFVMGRITGLALWAASVAQVLRSWEPRLPGWIGRYCDQLRTLLD